MYYITAWKNVTFEPSCSSFQFLKREYSLWNMSQNKNADTSLLNLSLYQKTKEGVCKFGLILKMKKCKSNFHAFSTILIFRYFCPLFKVEYIHTHCSSHQLNSRLRQQKFLPNESVFALVQDIILG